MQSGSDHPQGIFSEVKPFVSQSKSTKQVATSNYNKLLQLTKAQTITDFIPLFSMPRSGSTLLAKLIYNMLLKVKGGDHAKAWIDEVYYQNNIQLHRCHDSQPDTRDYDLTYRLAYLIHRLEVAKVFLKKMAGNDELAQSHKKVEKLIQQVKGARNFSNESTFLNSIEKKLQEIEYKIEQHLKNTGSTNNVKSAFICKEHLCYLGSIREFERLSLLNNKGLAIFTIRAPERTFVSFLLRGIAMNLSETGTIKNADVQRYVETFMYTDKHFTQQDIDDFFNKTFQGHSGPDKFSRQKLLQFIGKTVDDDNTKITPEDIKTFNDKIIQVIKMFHDISWLHLPVYYEHHKKLFPDSDKRIIIDYDTMLTEPYCVIKHLFTKLFPGEQFTDDLVDAWEADSNHFYSGALMAVGTGPEFFKNIWFHHVLKSTKIQAARGKGKSSIHLSRIPGATDGLKEKQDIYETFHSKQISNKSSLNSGDLEVTQCGI